MHDDRHNGRPRGDDEWPVFDEYVDDDGVPLELTEAYHDALPVCLDYAAGRLDPRDAEVVELRMKEDPVLKRLVDGLVDAYSATATVEELEPSWAEFRRRAGLPPLPLAVALAAAESPASPDDADLERSFADRVKKRKRVRILARLTPFGIAAALVISLLLSPAIYVLYSYHWGVVRYEAADATLTVLVPKQTRVTLSPRSTLRFKRFQPVEDNDRPRPLRLSGEATFAAAPPDEGRSHDFVVVTKEASILPLGTEFTVHAYPDERTTTVTVREGMVYLWSQELGAGRIRLDAGQSGRVVRGQPPERLP